MTQDTDTLNPQSAQEIKVEEVYSYIDIATSSSSSGGKDTPTEAETHHEQARTPQVSNMIAGFIWTYDD